ncbi:hypothetical protein BH18THE2_BH18THE2_25410 [soil metagenome]
MYHLPFRLLDVKVSICYIKLTTNVINSLKIIDVKGISRKSCLADIVEVSSSKPFYGYQRQFALCEVLFLVCNDVV